MSPSCQAIHDIWIPRQGFSRRFRSPDPCCWPSSVTRLTGCGRLAYRLDNSVPENFVPNPLELPPAEDDFVWSQVVDAVDDYFRIAREQPVQNSGGIILDGRVETSYRIGASLLEPWRKDSTSGFERLQSTLQSVRRRAIVTVRPGAAGYILEVIVQKDLEDTDRSQYATESTARTRHDGTVVRITDASTPAHKRLDGFRWDGTRRSNRSFCKTFTDGSPNRIARDSSIAKRSPSATMLCDPISRDALASGAEQVSGTNRGG